MKAKIKDGQLILIPKNNKEFWDLDKWWLEQKKLLNLPEIASHLGVEMCVSYIMKREIK